MNEVELNIISMIEEYKNSIAEFQTVANEESAWLFVSTVGCLGIPHKAMQFIALVITITFFTSRIWGRLSYNRSYKEITNLIMAEIAKLGEENDFVKARKYDLQEIGKMKKINTLASIKRFWPLIVSYLFYGVSFSMELFNM